MGLICEYFATSSDDEAASVIDCLGGPKFSVSGNGIEPVVQMRQLEALLTGRTYDEVKESKPGGAMVAMRDDGERLIVRVSDGLAEVLVGATDEELAQVALPWSQTEEFWGQASPELLAGFLRDLADLARQARSNSEHLYCWLCV